MIHVRSFILGSYPIRGFLAWAHGDHDAVFVDPGGWDDAIPATLAEHGLTLRAILLTHGHWDHTGGLVAMQEHLCAPVYAHATECATLPVSPDILLHGGESIACGIVHWQVLSLPGHTEGSLAYYCRDVVFTGDTLFAGSIGGTTTFSDYERERMGIRDTLFPLGDAIHIFPAHGPASVIGVERRSNPFLRAI